jgi:hypothetical protein
MDISADGSRTVVLTYGDVLEWQQDLSKAMKAASAIERDEDYTVSPLPQLMQAEGITYLATGDAIALTTETSRQTPAAPV